VNVELSTTAQQQLRKTGLPSGLTSSRFKGLQAARAIPGYRDHALKGQWLGYRAVRLNDAYRVISIERKRGVIETVLIEEVNKHDY
jgi:mRNA-degrading endonuclease YafQ of YafQ-DinJ toxin-antitoxin module